LARRYEVAVKYLLSYLSGFRLRARGMSVGEYIVVRNPFTIAALFVGPRGRYLLCAGDTAVCRALGEEYGVKTVSLTETDCPKKDGLGCVVYEP